MALRFCSRPGIRRPSSRGAAPVASASLLAVLGSAVLAFLLPSCESTVSHDKKYRRGGGNDIPMAVKMRRSMNRGY